MNNIIEVKMLSKSFGNIEAIKDISFNIEKGMFYGIVGPSGCGKSTLLNIIDGLDKEYQGSILINNIKVSYMLQNDALLPWLSVLDNALIGVKLERKINDEDIKYAKDLLISFGLEDFIYKKANTLSGGMKQRVA